ncbi:Putative cytochrome P450 143 [Frankliniella fusca]|uniref:Cytochrome P450 143 n=1 Tax=Frankliniella fusca TaxID=407009 RepID=A0AAE1LK55_9NEOP|nr:Putative cytochrome P450 143 [Frankliniella fusca]
MEFNVEYNNNTKHHSTQLHPPQLQALAGRRHSARTALLHSRVREVARLLNEFYGYLLVGYHGMGLMLQMVSTVDFIAGRVDAYALAMLPMLFTFFVSQAVFGQRLETSSEGVGWAAYQRAKVL